MIEDSRPVWPACPALFLDLDGTLLAFADEPSDVHVPAKVGHLLQELSLRTGGAMAIVSGRTIKDLDRLLTPSRFPVAGVHGLERRRGDGHTSVVNVDGNGLVRLARALQAFVDRHPGTLLEDKGVTLALHYRKRPELEEEVVRAVESKIAKSGPRVGLMRGNKVVEIRPMGHDKGTAIVDFMQEPPFSGRSPVFVGDDVTDEDGFRAVNSLNGLSVKVGGGETVAQARLPDIDGVLDWLKECVAREERS